MPHAAASALRALARSSRGVTSNITSQRRNPALNLRRKLRARRRYAGIDLERADFHRRGGGPARDCHACRRQPLEDALAFAHEIAGKSPHAIRAGKRLLNLAVDGDQHEILLEEAREQVALIGSPNQMEAVMANLEKRQPKFAEVATGGPAP